MNFLNGKDKEEKSTMYLLIFIIVVVWIVRKIMKPWMEDASYMNSLHGEHEKEKDLGTKISEHAATSMKK